MIFDIFQCKEWCYFHEFIQYKIIDIQQYYRVFNRWIGKIIGKVSGYRKMYFYSCYIHVQRNIYINKWIEVAEVLRWPQKACRAIERFGSANGQTMYPHTYRFSTAHTVYTEWWFQFHFKPSSSIYQYSVLCTLLFSIYKNIKYPCNYILWILMTSIATFLSFFFTIIFL